MVLVFKTSVRRKSELGRLKPELDKVVHNGRWNFDLEDRDKILRVETGLFIKDRLVNLMQEKGYLCTELPD